MKFLGVIAFSLLSIQPILTLACSKHSVKETKAHCEEMDRPHLSGITKIDECPLCMAEACKSRVFPHEKSLSSRFDKEQPYKDTPFGDGIISGLEDSYFLPRFSNNSFLENLVYQLPHTRDWQAYYSVFLI